MAFVTITVRARPGSSRTFVGGSFGEPPQLVVRVNAPAVDGRANRAVKEQVAIAFGVPASAVELVGGETARTKTLRIHGDVDGLNATLATLLNPAGAQPADLFGND